MMNHGRPVPPAVPAWYRLVLAFPALVLVFVLLGTAVCNAQPEEQYVQAYRVIAQADTLQRNQQTGPALKKYKQAQRDLLNLRKARPDWNPKLLAFRLNYVTLRIDELSNTNAPSATAGLEPGGAGPATGAATAAGPLRLLDAGAEPRQTLRLHPEPGQKQTAQTTIQFGTDTGMGMPLKMPPMILTLEATANTILTNGDIEYALVIRDAAIGEDPAATPQMVEALKAALEKFKDITVTGTMSSRGIPQGEAGVAGGEDPAASLYLDQMKESIFGATVPLPAEPVGPGARWEFKQQLKAQGMTLQQTASYELAAVEGDQLKIKATVAQRAASQKIENPAMPNVKIDLSKFTGRGTGEMTLDLGQLLPALATMESHSEAAMSVNLGGQKQTMTAKTDANLRMETLK